MTILKILTPEEPVLHQQAAPIERIKDPQLQQLIDRMIATMRHANGVGLAAPQIGQSLRLVVIETLAETDEEDVEIPDSRKLYTIINPQITWASRKMVKGIEGCLSIPGYLGEVARHQAIKVDALDRMGRKLNLSLKGWDARIFQHEIDHLDGILYTDRLTAPENFWSEEELRRQEEEEERREEESKGERE
jgi:peptide deformylase